MVELLSPKLGDHTIFLLEGLTDNVSLLFIHVATKFGVTTAVNLGKTVIMELSLSEQFSLVAMA